MIRRRPLKRRTPLRSRSDRQRRPDLAAARAAVSDRAGGRCEARTPRCTVRGAHAHHVVTRAHGGSDDPANLLWVCPSCHVYIHTHGIEARDRGWIRRPAA